MLLIDFRKYKDYIQSTQQKSWPFAHRSSNLCPDVLLKNSRGANQVPRETGGQHMNKILHQEGRERGRERQRWRRTETWTTVRVTTQEEHSNEMMPQYS